MGFDEERLGKGVFTVQEVDRERRIRNGSLRGGVRRSCLTVCPSPLEKWCRLLLQEEPLYRGYIATRRGWRTVVRFTAQTP